MGLDVFEKAAASVGNQIEQQILDIKTKFPSDPFGKSKISV
jgi:hypothetical protein